MSGIEGENPTREQIESMRNSVKEHIENNGKDVFDDHDVQRIMNDDAYVCRFFKHVFESTGDQLESATNMIIKAFQWRKEFGVNSLTEDKLSEGLKSKGVLYLRNRDKDGKRLIIFAVKKHLKGAEVMDDLKRYFIYILERIDREDNGDLFTLVFDCAGCGLKNMDLEIIQYMIGVMKDYFPYVLNYILVYEMPWVMSAAWKLIKSWLPPAAVKKIKFLSKSNMGDYVLEDQRLTAWGGTDDWEYEFIPEMRKKMNGTDLVVSSNDDSSSSDGEGKKKNVTFSHSQDNNAKDSNKSPNVEEAGQTIITAPINTPTNEVSSSSTHVDLLSLTPREEIIFSSNKSPQELMGKIIVKNISNDPIVYKIKTTSPEKYRVRPSMANVPPGESSQIEIQAPANLIVVGKDKFLVTAVTVQETGLSHHNMTDIMKNSEPESQYRLKCSIDSAISSNYVNPPSILTKAPESPSNLVMIEQDNFKDLTKKVTKLVQEHTELRETTQSLKTWITVLLVFSGILILLNLWSFFSSKPNICIFPDISNDSNNPTTSAKEL